MKYYLSIVMLIFSINVSASTCKSWIGSVENKELNEISGLAFSKLHQQVLYAHNDSGDKPRFFAMDESGKNLGEFLIDGIKSIDWEDMTTMTCPGTYNGKCLAFGDFGNNRYNRKLLTIYIVKEPKSFGHKGPKVISLLKKIEFTLDTKEQNFESLFAEGSTLYMISKMDSNAGSRYPGEEGKSILYKLNRETKKAESIHQFDLLNTKEFFETTDEGEMKRKVPNYYSWATGADLSADGKSLYLLTYGTVFKYSLGRGGVENSRFENYQLLEVPGQPQVEAIAVKGRKKLVVSEYLHQPIFDLNCQ